MVVSALARKVTLKLDKIKDLIISDKIHMRESRIASSLV